MTLVFEPRRKGENARDYAYAVLRENIANLNLEPVPGGTLQKQAYPRSL